MAPKFNYGLNRRTVLDDIARQLIETPLLPETIEQLLIGFDETWNVPRLGEKEVRRLLENTVTS